MKNKRFRLGVAEIAIIIIVSVVVSCFATGIIMYKSYNYDTSYANANSDKALQNFISVYATVLDKYYEEIDTTEMVDSAIDGMMEYLDDKYSTYLSVDEATALQEQLDGEYEGIGIQITEGNAVYQVFDDSPAQKAGIKVNDVIIEVDGENVELMKIEDIATLIKSKEGDFILKVRRENEILEFTLEVDSLFVPAVSTQVIEENNKKIGYLYISTFSSTISQQVSKALIKLEKEGIDSLIVDVRYNSGGYLDGAEGVANLFLEKGKVIYYLESKGSKIAYKDDTKESREYNIVVLVNGASASAAEILAGALKESYGATLVGTTTYGKGKVQQTKDLSDGSMIKYTTAKWLMPNEVCIDGSGIEADYEIELEIDEQTKIVKDTQLLKAIDLLSK